MSDRTAGNTRGLRIALIAALVAVSIGLIAYSCLAVSYPVGSERLSELTVTYLSLSHSVEREADGRLTSPDYPEAEVAAPEPAKPVSAPAVSKATQSAEELAAKKPAAKKKPAKKPAKKPSPKKPSKGKKPCPT